MKQAIQSCILAVMITFGAVADEQVADLHVPQAGLVGKARLKVLFWKVYDAELYAPNGEWDEDRPFALTLNYLRKLDGDKIAKRTISEIRDQGFDDEVTLARWYEEIRNILPDVEKDTRITGICDGNGNTLFYRNGNLIGAIEEPLFTDRFFNIWLGDKTSQPKMRDKLLGETD